MTEGDYLTRAALARDELLLEMSNVRPTDAVEISKESPVNIYVRNLSGMTGKTYFTTQQVADQLGVSVQVIRKHSKPDKEGKRVTQAPSYVAPFGKGKVHLYTPEDVEALRGWIYGRRKVYAYDDIPPELLPVAKEAE